MDQTGQVPADAGAAADQQADPAQVAEDQEWADAAQEIFPGLKSNKPEEEKKPDEPAKPAEESKKEEAKPPAPEDKKPDAKPGDGDEASAKSAEGTGEDDGAEEERGSGTSAANTRVAARQAAQEVETVKSDIRKQMFAEAATELKDADGDPIRTVEDVMKLQNPRTGEPFTADEAGVWLVQAQQQLARNLANTDSQINSIAEVNVGLKDEADIVREEYGELLKAMPDLQKKLWDSYQKTLTRDDKTGIITKAPVPLREFYTMALDSYAQLGRKLEAEEDAKVQADQAATTAKSQQRQQTRADRSDIYTGGKTDNLSDEDKEWADAATAVFGPRK